MLKRKKIKRGKQSGIDFKKFNFKKQDLYFEINYKIYILI